MCGGVCEWEVCVCVCVCVCVRVSGWVLCDRGYVLVMSICVSLVQLYQCSAQSLTSWMGTPHW